MNDICIEKNWQIWTSLRCFAFLQLVRVQYSFTSYAIAIHRFLPRLHIHLGIREK
jgi:hypothetical protein